MNKNNKRWFGSIDFQTEDNSYWFPLFFENCGREEAEAQLSAYKKAIQNEGHRITRFSNIELYEVGSFKSQALGQAFQGMMNGMIVELDVEHFEIKRLVELLDRDSLEDFEAVDCLDEEMITALIGQNKLPIRLLTEFTGARDFLAIKVIHP